MDHIRHLWRGGGPFYSSQGSHDLTQDPLMNNLVVRYESGSAQGLPLEARYTIRIDLYFNPSRVGELKLLHALANIENVLICRFAI